MTLTASVCAAVWLGVLCAISPCPLATNIAAASFISRDLKPLRTLFGGLAYALGRAVAYCGIAAALVSGLTAAPELSHALQKHTGRIMGPLLVLVAAVLLDLVRLPSLGTGRLAAVQNRLGSSGLLGAFLLGMLFALAFCPTSAALYFGSLIPLTLNRNSPVLLPLAFGVASALPIIAVAALFACGFRKVGVWFNRLAIFEKHLRLVTGILFLAVGIALTVKNVL